MLSLLGRRYYPMEKLVDPIKVHDRRGVPRPDSDGPLPLVEVHPCYVLDTFAGDPKNHPVQGLCHFECSLSARVGRGSSRSRIPMLSIELGSLGTKRNGAFELG